MSNDKNTDMKYLLRAIRRIAFLFSALFALTSCGRNDKLSSFVDNPEKLHPEDAMALQTWIGANNFATDEIHAGSEGGHQGDVSVLISDRRVSSIKATGVSSLEGLVPLPELLELNLSEFQGSDLSDSPPSLEKLRLRGTKLKSLDGIEMSKELRELEFFWTSIVDLAPLSGLKNLSRLSAERQTLETVSIPSSLKSLTLLNLAHNKIASITGLENLTSVEVLILDDNQLTEVKGIDSLPALKSLNLTNNQISDLSSIAASNSVEKINLKGNPLTDLSLLSNWPALAEVSSDEAAGTVPGKLIKKETLTDAQVQEQEARSLKAKYLENANFVEEPSLAANGRTEGVRKQISSHFSLNGKSGFKGEIAINKLSGSVRLPVAETDNLEFQNKEIKISGTVSVESGSLTVYSPVEINFWSQASLFVDRPVRRGEVPDGLVLKGYVAREITPGSKVPFSANLLPFASRYALLLDSGEEGAVNVHFVLE